MKTKWIYLISLLALVAAGTLYYYSVLAKNEPAYNGTDLSGAAADFSLLDQNGTPINFSDLRGKVVILTFMDSKCMDTCPITAVHFREVYKQLD